MNASGSPTGFGQLMSPFGIAMLIGSILVFAVMIKLGSIWVRTGEERAREERRQLKRLVEERDRKRAEGLSRGPGSGV